MWYHSAPPSIKNRKCTASTARIVSTPATSIVAVPTLNGPYRAPYTRRSPTANGTAVGEGAGALAVTLSDPDVPAGRVESAPPVSASAPGEGAIARTAAAAWAARVTGLARPASSTCGPR